MKLFKFLISLFFFGLLLTSARYSFASTNSNFTIFVGRGCPHCAKVEQFVKQNNIKVKFKEVYFNSVNRKEFLSQVEKCGLDVTRAGVPMMVEEDKCYVGDKPIITFLQQKLDSRKVHKEKVPAQNKKLSKNENALTLPLVIGAASVDAINPCAFAVLIVLMTAVLLSKKRQTALLSGIAFSFAIFISYFLMGLGIYKALSLAKFSDWFIKLIAVLSIVIGLLNIKDYVNYGGFGFKMEVPDSWRPKLRNLITSVSSPYAAFGIGIIVSLFLLPCTSGPYVVILGMLSQKSEFWRAVMWLLLYNFIFILPMLIITLVVYKGMSPSRLEKVRQSRLKLLHLIAGLIMIGMGVVILATSI